MNIYGADIFHGDCREHLRKIPDGSMQLIATSPPYNIDKEYEKKRRMAEYINDQRRVIWECAAKLKPTGSICWQVGNHVERGVVTPLDCLMYPIFADLGLHMRGRIVWTFGAGLHCKKRFSGRYEVILWFTKSDDYVFNLDPVRVPSKYPNKRYFKGPKKGRLSGNPLGKNPSDVWVIPNVKYNHVEKTDHPAQFPVELVERLVLSLTNKGDRVYDPYIGSGTTAVAALKHDRNCSGSEKKKEYISIIRRRLKLLDEGKLKTRPMGRPIYGSGGEML